MNKFRQIPGVAKVRLGETIPSPTVNRVDVADGTKGRCILLSPDWYAVSVAYTEQPKRGAYYVDQDKVLKYGLQARIYYVAIVARLNTGAKGDILDDNIRIEYLRLSEDVYEEFANDASEMGNFQTVALTKVTKGQFSYIKPKASNRKQDAKLLASVMEKIKGYDVNALYALAFLAIARPFDDYIKALKEAGQDVEPHQEQIQGRLPESFQAAALPEPTEVEAEEVDVETDEFAEETDEFEED